MQANEILTERLRLRPLCVQDAEAIRTIRAFEDVHKYLMVGPYQTLAAAEQWIVDTTSSSRNYIFTVSLLDSSEQEVIGVLGLNRFLTLVYMFHPHFWGKGYCTEALHAFCKSIFAAQPILTHLEAAVDEKNLASQRVLEKVGFTRRFWFPAVVAPVPGTGEDDAESEDDGGDGVVTEEQLSDLQKAVGSMGLQNGPAIEPTRLNREDRDSHQGGRRLIRYYLRKTDFSCRKK